MRRIIFFGLLLSQVVAAAEVRPFPKSELKKAVELVQEFLTAPAPSRAKFRTQVQALEPGGPVFVDQALKLIAARREKWKSGNEPRSSMLRLVNQAILGSLPWEGFEASRLKQSIHESAQSLLKLFPNSSVYQTDLLEIFDRLDLWDATDMKFLIRKSFSGIVGARYFPRIVENFDAASAEDKRLMLERTRKQSPRELAPYALAYQTGWMDQQDYLWLLRLFMDNGLGSNDVPHLVPRSPEPIGNLTEKEILARNYHAVDGLIHDVQQDVHARLRAGDPLIKAAYDEARGGKWPGRVLSVDDKLLHQHYLRALYTGSVITGCDQRLYNIKAESGD